jgi:hypothetical protein
LRSIVLSLTADLVYLPSKYTLAMVCSMLRSFPPTAS